MLPATRFHRFWVWYGGCVALGLMCSCLYSKTGFCVVFLNILYYIIFYILMKGGSGGGDGVGSG